MEHMIALCKDLGNESRLVLTKPLRRVIDEIWSNPDALQLEKHDSRLLSMGYSKIDGEYHRGESSFTNISVMIIDCDNKQNDRNILKRFNHYIGSYEHWTYESASSTEDCPKFRAIIPLDSEIEWTKYTKSAISQLFSIFADDHASWFYEPTRGKQHTLTHHDGKLFPSKAITHYVNKMEKEEQMRLDAEKLHRMMWKLNHPNQENNPEGWRNLPSVKKCLSGLCRGERDNSLNAACYAMNKNGYRGSIREFLDEVDVPRDIKQKFYSKYR